MFLPMLGPKAIEVVKDRRPSSSTSVSPVSGSITGRVPTG